MHVLEPALEKFFQVALRRVVQFWVASQLRLSPAGRCKVSRIVADNVWWSIHFGDRRVALDSGPMEVRNIRAVARYL